LLIRYPGVVKPGTVNDDLVCMLDFAPTFLEIAGAKIPEDLQGRSIMSLLQGRTPAEWREGVYYHFYTGYGIPEHYGVRTKTHKLLHFPTFRDGSYWELFDLTEDADELTNVYTKPEYQDVSKTLHALLTAYEKKLKVPGKS